MEAIGNRLKTPYYGYVLLAFVAVNWREIFYVLAANVPVDEKIEYFDSRTSVLELLIIPLCVGAAVSIVAPWLKLAFEYISTRPASMIAERALQAEHKLTILRTKLEHDRNKMFAEQEQAVIERARRESSLAEIEDPVARDKAETELHEIRLQQAKLDKDSNASQEDKRRASKRIAESYRSLSELSRRKGDYHRAEEMQEMALAIEKQLLDDLD